MILPQFSALAIAAFLVAQCFPCGFGQDGETGIAPFPSAVTTRMECHFVTMTKKL
jgi:hypothetical protein